MKGEVAVFDVDCGLEVPKLSSWIAESFNAREVGSLRWMVELDGAACIVELTRCEPRTVGRLMLPRTRMRVEGHPQALAEYKRLFMLRFASAGG